MRVITSVTIEDCEKGIAITDISFMDCSILHISAPACVKETLPCISAKEYFSFVLAD